MLVFEKQQFILEVCKVTEAEKTWIDRADYRELLTKFRREPIGSTWLSGEVGTYLAKALSVKRKQLSDEERIAIAKSIPWLIHENT